MNDKIIEEININNVDNNEKSKKNKTLTYTIIAIELITVSMLVWSAISYNTLIKKEEKVKIAWSQVESNLQRKLDLLPNLVNVVKKYSKHEKELLTEITELRSNALKTLNDKNQNNISKVQETQTRLNRTMFKLFAVTENYPELKSSEHFLQLQSQIEGTENRINITRMLFNSAVGEYNSYKKTIPANIISNIAGFSEKTYFKANTEAHKNFKLEM